MNLICQNCSINGGYGLTYLETDSLSDFATDGSVQLQLSDMAGNVSLDVQLFPGFKVVDTSISIYNKTLGTISIGDDAQVALVFEILIPIQIKLETPVNVTTGFTFALPGQAVLDVSVGDRTVDGNGFDKLTVQPLPLSYNIPGLTVELVTGLQMRVYANASISGNDDFRGLWELALDIPRYTVTGQLLENVDSTCQPPSSGEQSYRYAARLSGSIACGLHTAGELEVSGRTFEAPETKFVNFTLPAEPLCFPRDRLEGSAGVRNSVTAWSVIPVVVSILVGVFQLL